MKRTTTTAILSLALAMFFLAGCKPSSQKESQEPVVAASPTPSPVPKMGAVIENPTFALSDRNGDPVTKITAQSAAATGTQEADALGEMTKATATLYQKGKPVATLTADKLKASGETRILTATGNVLVETTDAPGDKKSVRADTVRWEYDTNKIVGHGNVVLKQGNAIRIPATSFVADTALKKCDLQLEKAPITGTY